MTSAASETRTAERIRARIGDEWRDAEQVEADVDPYRGDVVAYSPVSTDRDCEDAIAAAWKARKVMAAMPGYERAALLRRAGDVLDSRAETIAELQTRESGKAIRDSLGEVRRSAELLRIFAEEAVRIAGEHVPLDGSPVGAGKLAMVLRFPVGVVVGITPFNAPISSAAHKLGPAIAAGNSIILKPSPKAPLCVHEFVKAVVDAGAPPGAVNSLYGDVVGPRLVSDQRVDFVSFTGSIPVGKIIRNSVGMKRVALELGGIGPAFVYDDCDVQAAAKACARHAMLVAGQSCASVQNVFVMPSVYDRFMDTALAEIDTLRFGDPLDPATEIGTMIDEQAAVRVEQVVQRAAEAGATMLRGGDRDGALLTSAVVTDVDADMDIVGQELFGPGMTIQRRDDFDQLFETISESRYGLQCGVFTGSLDRAMNAVRSIRTGGIMINSTPRWRTDHMPYGGVKDSGIGREGAKTSTLDMTEERLFVFT